MTPRFSIITTCKGRLENLKHTLPKFLRQENTEVVVVDHDCPDHTMVMSVLGTTSLEPDLKQSLLDQVNHKQEPLYSGKRDFPLELTFPDKYQRGFCRKGGFRVR